MRPEAVLTGHGSTVILMPGPLTLAPNQTRAPGNQNHPSLLCSASPLGEPPRVASHRAPGMDSDRAGARKGPRDMKCSGPRLGHNLAAGSSKTTWRKAPEQSTELTRSRFVPWELTTEARQYTGVPTPSSEGERQTHISAFPIYLHY